MGHAAPTGPLRSIAVFGLGAFVAASIGVTLYVSGVTGLRTTQSLLAGQAEDLLDSLEAVIMAELAPVQAQAHWVTSAFAEGRIDLARRERLDAFMLGALGTTPQVTSLAVVEPSGRARRWDRDERSARSEDWSARAPILEWVRQGPTCRARAGVPRCGPALRRAAINKKDRLFGCPTIVFPSEMTDDPLKENLITSIFVAKYGSIIVLSNADPQNIFPLLVYRQNIYTAPRKPMAVDQKIYEINNPDADSPVLITTNFSLRLISLFQEKSKAAR